MLTHGDVQFKLKMQYFRLFCAVSELFFKVRVYLSVQTQGSSHYTEAQKRAEQRYAANTDLLRIRMKKGRKAEIAAFAKMNGETIGQFVNRAIEETMTR